MQKNEVRSSRTSNYCGDQEQAIDSWVEIVEQRDSRMEDLSIYSTEAQIKQEKAVAEILRDN